MGRVLNGGLGVHLRGWLGPAYWSYGWPWPGLIWLGFVLLFWGGLLALLVWAVRSSAPRRAPDTALDVLRRRFAAGEISEEEYDHIRRLLAE